ncbi:hypothetical protein CDAR_47641 [Caerostris darwini]|uniref:Uncharacterized protein n=1 Tax=Caerostris darwini TaxID=1538125 RepID=A0AAV4M8F3_9ARAC|nr:hypothetical protein CDAR_47641 [Caerostris darwini]
MNAVISQLKIVQGVHDLSPFGDDFLNQGAANQTTSTRKRAFTESRACETRDLQSGDRWLFLFHLVDKVKLLKTLSLKSEPKAKINSQNHPSSLLQKQNGCLGFRAQPRGSPRGSSMPDDR